MPAEATPPPRSGTPPPQRPRALEQPRNEASSRMEPDETQQLLVSLPMKTSGYPREPEPEPELEEDEDEDEEDDFDPQPAAAGAGAAPRAEHRGSTTRKLGTSPPGSPGSPGSPSLSNGLSNRRGSMLERGRQSWLTKRGSSVDVLGKAEMAAMELTAATTIQKSWRGFLDRIKVDKLLQSQPLPQAVRHACHACGEPCRRHTIRMRKSEWQAKLLAQCRKVGTATLQLAVVKDPHALQWRTMLDEPGGDPDKLLEKKSAKELEQMCSREPALREHVNGVKFHSQAQKKRIRDELRGKAGLKWEEQHKLAMRMVENFAGHGFDRSKLAAEIDKAQDHLNPIDHLTSEIFEQYLLR
jgi:hypothetical protein